jgi:SAM-dependent methyltransferase
MDSGGRRDGAQRLGGFYNSGVPRRRPADDLLRLRDERMAATDANHAALDPSAWVYRWLPYIPSGGRVLDLAAGSGRHARLLAARGHPVSAVDRDADVMRRLDAVAGIRTCVADIEAGSWPYPDETFEGVVVTNYLHRPLLPLLVAAVAPGGVLIYETFAAGNERFGRPANPDFLLRPGELLDAVRGRLRVLAYEDLEVEAPKRAMVQRICARRSPVQSSTAQGSAAQGSTAQESTAQGNGSG